MGGPDKESQRPPGATPDDYEEDSATEIAPARASHKLPARPPVDTSATLTRPGPAAGVRPSRPPLPAAARSTKPPPLPRPSVRPLAAAIRPLVPPADESSVTDMTDIDGPPTLAGVSKSPLSAPQSAAPFSEDSTTARREIISDSDEDQTTKVSTAQIQALLDEASPLSSRMPAATPPPNTVPIAAQHRRSGGTMPVPAPLAPPIGHPRNMVPNPPPTMPQPYTPAPWGGSHQARSAPPPGHYLGSVPSIPVIPPLLPNGEAIALEPARFDPPSLAVLRGDVKLPYIGQPPSSKNLIEPAAPNQSKWVAVALVAIGFALSVAALVVWIVLRRH